MAALSQDPKSKTYRILFWFGGKQYHKSLKTTDKEDAEAKKGGIEEMLQAMERGWTPVPAPDRFWPFLFSGGKLDAKPSVPDVLTLERSPPPTCSATSTSAAGRSSAASPSPRGPSRRRSPRSAPSGAGASSTG